MSNSFLKKPILFPKQSTTLEDRGNTIPIVSHANLCKINKVKILFANEKEADALSTKDCALYKFLKHLLRKVFGDEIPNEFPPLCKEDDHRIDLISGTLPPNRLPYQV